MNQESEPSGTSWLKGRERRWMKCAVCYFISRKTYYKWRKKDGGNRTHISKKEHPGTKIKGEIKVFICNEKRELTMVPKMKLLIKRRFNVDISTTAIYKFYKKKNLVFRPQKKLACALSKTI